MEKDKINPFAMEAQERFNTPIYPDYSIEEIEAKDSIYTIIIKTKIRKRFDDKMYVSILKSERYFTIYSENMDHRREYLKEALYFFNKNVYDFMLLSKLDTNLLNPNGFKFFTLDEDQRTEEERLIELRPF